MLESELWPPYTIIPSYISMHTHTHTHAHKHKHSGRNGGRKLPLVLEYFPAVFKPSTFSNLDCGLMQWIHWVGVKVGARLCMHVTSWGDTGAHTWTLIKKSPGLRQAVHLELHRCTAPWAWKDIACTDGFSFSGPQSSQPSL